MGHGGGEHRAVRTCPTELLRGHTAPGGPGGDSDPRPPPRSSWGRAAAAARCSCAPLPGYGSGGGGEGTGSHFAFRFPVIGGEGTPQGLLPRFCPWDFPGTPRAAGRERSCRDTPEGLLGWSRAPCSCWGQCQACPPPARPCPLDCALDCDGDVGGGCAWAGPPLSRPRAGDGLRGLSRPSGGPVGSLGAWGVFEVAVGSLGGL